MLLVLNTEIVVPTADDYAKRLGASESFSGLVIALTPFWQGILGVPLNYAMLRCGISIKSMIIIMAAGSVAGNVLYAALSGRKGFCFLLKETIRSQGSSETLSCVVQSLGDSECFFSGLPNWKHEALAGLMQFKCTILISRAMIGICQCQLAGPIYIARSVGVFDLSNMVQSMGLYLYSKELPLVQ